MTTNQQHSTAPAGDGQYVTVTVLELDVLAGLAAGMNWAGIAKALSMLEYNAKWLGRRLRKKLGAANATHAVAIAYESGLLPRRDPHTMQISFPLTATEARNLDAMCTEGFRKLRDDCPENVRAMARAVLDRVLDAITVGREQLTGHRPAEGRSTADMRIRPRRLQGGRRA